MQREHKYVAKEYITPLFQFGLTQQLFRDHATFYYESQKEMVYFRNFLSKASRNLSTLKIYGLFTKYLAFLNGKKIIMGLSFLNTSYLLEKNNLWSLLETLYLQHWHECKGDEMLFLL